MRPALCAAIEEFTPELKLLLACGTTQDEGNSAREFERLLNQKLEWEVVLDRAVLHGMAPLLAWRLEPLAALVSTAIRAKLQDIRTEALWHNLRLTQSLLQILGCFEARGILAVAFKGPFLAERLYGHLAQRQCSDIDIFIRQQDVPAAIEAARSIGFVPEHTLSSKRVAQVTAADFELSVMRTGLTAELHWSGLPRFYGIAFGLDEAQHRLRSVSALNTQMLELAPEDLFLALALHGCKHFWARMIWALDLAQLLRANPDLQWELLLAQSRRLHAERLVLISVLLIQKLFDITVPACIQEQWHLRPELQSMCSDVCCNLAADTPQQHSVKSYWFFLRARDDWVDRARQVLRHLFIAGPGEWSALPEFLPRSFFLPFHIARLGAKMCRSAWAVVSRRDSAGASAKPPV
jgi:hypothetical protein